MAAATVDMNQKIILNNLDIIEEQRRQMYHVVDQFVDKVTDAGMQWTTRKERSHSTFLDIQKITSKAMAFLSLKCDEIKSELESETSYLIVRDEFTQQQKHAQMDPVAKPVTTHGKGKEDDTDDVKKTHTSRNPNIESDQQTRYQDVYNQLRSVLAKQDELDQQLNMKLNNLREDTESLKSDVGTFNQYVETGKTLLSDYSQKLETLENTVSCLSDKGNEMYSDQQVLVDRINSHLSDKGEQVNTDLSAKVAQISTDLSAKVDQINTDLSAKVSRISTDLTDKGDQVNTDLSEKVAQITTDLSAKVDQINTDLSAKVAQISTDLTDKVYQINTDLSAKVDQINTDLSANGDQINLVLQTLTNSEKEHAAQMNKIIALEKHFNTMEKDTQNNFKQVEQQDELGAKLLDVSQKLIQLSVGVATKNDFGTVGFNAATTLPPGSSKDSAVGMFEPPAFITGCQFNSDSGIFTASLGGVYLAYVSMYLEDYGFSCVELIHEYTDGYDEDHELWLEEEAQICLVRAKRKGSTMCSLDVIEMEEGDKLFIRTPEYSNASCRIQFLCFRLG